MKLTKKEKLDNSYLLKYTDTEKAKMEMLKKKYSLNFREVISQLIEKAE